MLLKMLAQNLSKSRRAYFSRCTCQARALRKTSANVDSPALFQGVLCAALSLKRMLLKMLAQNINKNFLCKLFCMYHASACFAQNLSKRL